MISLDEALASYGKHLIPLSLESLPVPESLARVLAEDVRSATDLPRFDQSAMDGYALCAADTQSGSCTLPVAGISAAGRAAPSPLAAGTAQRIFTGARIPPGADTVIPQERVHRSGDALQFQEAYPIGKNIRYRGEEIRAGATIASRGTRVTPGLVSSLINAGVDKVQIRRQPRISILVSGDEVRPAGTPLAEGEIPDSNGPLIQALMKQWGHSAPEIIHLLDDEQRVRETLGQALDRCDLVITTGGASVGDKDFLPQAARALGVQEVFWKVAQKPGKPMFFGTRGTTALLSLPGNPAAVLVGMVLHVRRVLDILECMNSPNPQFHAGRLAGPVRVDIQRAQLLRMRLEVDEAGTSQLHLLPKQDSHMLSNLAQADVLAWIPVGDEMLPEGATVRWTRLS